MLKIVPLTLAQAKSFITAHHRHHAAPVGHRWSIGVEETGPDGSVLVGVAVCGRPKARALPQYSVLEVNRLATTGAPNACSKLLAACARIAKEMGFERIETAVLDEEPGTTLRAAGWPYLRTVKGRDWNSPARGGRRRDQPMCDKRVYGKNLV